MHVVASSCFIAFISVCTFQFFLQMIRAVFLKFCVPSSRFLWAGFLILLNDIYFGFVFSICSDSNNSVPQKMCLCFCVLCTVEDKSVMVFEAHFELNS